MTRPLRSACSGAVYHVMSRGKARHVIMVDTRYWTQFVTLLPHMIDRNGWPCHA